MKRILFLTYYHSPDLCAGSFRNTPLANELSDLSRDMDVAIDLYTTIPNRYGSFDAVSDPVERSGNLTIRRLDVPRHKSGLLDQIRSFYSYYKQVMKSVRNQEYDLVYASSSRFFTSWLGYRIARKKGCKLYIDVRDIFSESLHDLSKHLFVRNMVVPVIKQLERLAYKRADHINLISEGFLPLFKEYRQEKISFYTHGVDPLFVDAFGSLNSESAEKRLSGHKIRILYAGNIGEAQDLHRIIPEIAASLEQTHHFTIIGDGSALPRLKSAVRERSLRNVTLRKPINREALVLEYKNSDLLLMHVQSTGVFKKVLPSKIFELAATGKPIVAGIEGYAVEFIKKQIPGVGIFTPGDPEDAISTIRALSRDYGVGEPIDRSEFVENYLRTTIDREMAGSILGCLGFRV